MPFRAAEGALQPRKGGTQLSLSTVDEDEIGQLKAALDIVAGIRIAYPPLKGPLYYFSHAFKIVNVALLHIVDVVRPVQGLLRLALHEHDLACDRVVSVQMRDIVRFDAPRPLLQLQQRAHVIHCLDVLVGQAREVPRLLRRYALGQVETTLHGKIPRCLEHYPGGGSGLPLGGIQLVPHLEEVVQAPDVLLVQAIGRVDHLGQLHGMQP
mmetsp:Transcript_2719/g.11197  ORF Transcript_2719/g.11197 Transcript_2719/m.11197 type:complete len:210 (-) Transcript_2719:922-1551(-)|eukprot:scaffold29_cov251-Pinguiococcus_pyrenoidosus.AAC.17